MSALCQERTFNDSKTMMSQPSFADRSLATNDVIDYFCLNREALRIAS